MPTPVGPVPPDPNDPDLWEEWYDDPWEAEAARSGRRPSHWSRSMRFVGAVLLIGFAIYMITR